MKTETIAHNAPIKKYKCGYVSVALWQNTSKDGKEFLKATLDRSYKDDKDGLIKSSNSLRLTDLADAVAALNFAIMENCVKFEKKEDRQDKI
jgi:hypothetical protein